MSQSDKMKTKIIELLHEQPKLCRNLNLQWARSPDGIRKMAAISKLLGAEIAELVMDWITPEQWRMIQMASDSAPDSIETAQLMIQSVTAMELTWEESHTDFEDPFEFLLACRPESKSDLLRLFEPEEWALVSLFWSQEDTLLLAKQLPSEKRCSFILAMERLKKLPADSVRVTARGFANRVRYAFESVDAESKPFVQEVATPIPAVLVEEAVEAFSLIRSKEAEIEARITEMLSEVDPELSKQLQNILSQNPAQCEVE